METQSTRDPFVRTGDATALLPVDGMKPITVIGTETIRGTFDDLCIMQAKNARRAPGVAELVLNPDAHCGYGAPVGCVLASPSHVYPGPVGVDGWRSGPESAQMATAPSRSREPRSLVWRRPGELPLMSPHGKLSVHSSSPMTMLRTI